MTNNKNAPVLVTGATGFLGRHVVEELIQRDQQVSILVRNQKKAETIFRGKPVNIIVGSLTEPASLIRLPCKAHIVHCAAAVGSINSSERFYEAVNVEGTKHLLAAAVCRGAVHFTAVSSISAVGAAASFSQPMSELTVPNPNTFYGKSKLAMEKMLFALAPSWLPITLIRPSLIYGSQQEAKSGSNRLFLHCQKRIIPVFGTATNLLSLGNVRNIAAGLLDLSFHAGREIFHLSDRKPYSLIQISQIFHQNSHKKFYFLRLPYRLAKLTGFIADQLSGYLKRDIAFCSENIKHFSASGFVMDIQKALAFGYQPKLDLTDF